MEDNFNIEISSSRLLIDYLEIDKNFVESDDEIDYYFNCNINLNKRWKKCRKNGISTIDENKIMDDKRDIVDIADSKSGDLCHSIFAFVNSKLEIEEREDAILTDHMCYIGILYINPDYRKKRCGYIFNTKFPQNFVGS